MGFLDLARGLRSPTYQAARQPHRLPMSMVPELGVVLATPGFGLNHWFHAFGWSLNDPEIQQWAREVKLSGDLDVAKANSLSIGLRDGLQWLQSLLVMRPSYYGSAPFYVALALREGHVRAEDLGVSQGRLAQWKLQDASLAPIAGW